MTVSLIESIIRPIVLILIIYLGPLSYFIKNKENINNIRDFFQVLIGKKGTGWGKHIERNFTPKVIGVLVIATNFSDIVYLILFIKTWFLALIQ